MQFGPVPIKDAIGAVLAHSVQVRNGRLRKGVKLTADHVAQMKQAGIGEVTVARLGPNDVPEDEAATRLAKALVPEPDAVNIRIGRAGTGRSNLFSTAIGVAQINANGVDAVNAIDPMITVATVPEHARIGEGGMLATVKIISYGVDVAHLDAACAAAHAAISVAPVRRRNVVLIETTLDAQPLTKGAVAVSDRVAAMGGNLTSTTTCHHRVDALATELASCSGDLILILTASATSDVNDTAPSAVLQAGGRVTHFGMPVDPGNLLFLAELNGIPVIGLPGCARSPALNGADWVLERVMCGIDVTSRDIMAMGVGGLLKEIPSRPQPRKPASP